MLLHNRLLFRNLQLCLRGLDILVILHQLLRNNRLCDPNGNDFDTGRPLVAIALESFGQLFIEGVKLVDVNLLKRVLRTKLVNFVAVL